MHSEETKIMSGTQAGDAKFLLSRRGRGLFEHSLHAVKIFLAGDALAADRAVMRKKRFTRSLHSGYGAALFFRDTYQAFRGTARTIRACIEVIADHMKERIVFREAAGTEQRMRVARWLGLFNKLHVAIARRGGELRRIAGRNHNGNFVHTRPLHFVEDDAQNRLLAAVTVDERLKGQRTLIAAGRRDNSFLDFQTAILAWRKMNRVIRHTTLTIATRGKGLYDFTRAAKEWLRKQEISNGLLTVFIQHTSCSLTIQENADPDVTLDLRDFFERLVPENMRDYRHTTEGADDMTSHIRSTLTHTSLSIPVIDGGLTLGTWQGLYVFEHRARAHQRRVVLQLMGEAES